MNKTIIIALAAALAANARADVLKVEAFSHYGPYAVTPPVMVDSVDVKGKKIGSGDLSHAPKRLSLKGNPVLNTKTTAANSTHAPAVGILTFDFENTSFAKPTVEVAGVEDFTLYLDGEKVEGKNLTLKPSTHTLAVRYHSPAGSSANDVAVTIKAENEAGLSARTDGKRRFTLEDVLHGPHINSVSVSPDGKFAIWQETVTRRGGKGTTTYRVSSLDDGRIIAETGTRIAWMPNGSRYYHTAQTVDGTDIVAIDAATGVKTTVASDVPSDVAYIFTPDEKSLILFTSEEGHKEDPGVYQILEPEDRQPGWRNRSSLSILDLATGVRRPLTFGNRNVSFNDISDDSGKILFSTSRSRLERRPTTLFSLYCLNLADMSVDTLVEDDGFIGRGIFSPDGKKVLLSGTPESLSSIGKNVPEGRTPSMTDNQLYLIDIATKEARPLTRGFNPSIGSFSWSRADGQIYLTAENRDEVSLFRLNPATGVFSQISIPEDHITGYSLPRTGRRMIWHGESVSKPQSVYALDTKTLKSTLLETPKADQISDVKLGVCEAWDFVNSRGDTICGRFYLPPDFDPAKKYPMIVNYYGGCSPTSRNFESRYPHNAYAAQGYVVYVIEPSGATGFGQEFSSRHVNTAGEGVAQDIIEGVKEFCRQHPYVNDKKIGCIGASYGGFMTQYLQTVTDIFAAAISHAGISDHTSYWGEGYWGYSYSEVSMANSYPWSDQELYVKQSPLYNADKIHTPLLFLHGDHDNNVPVGESIQMFTALKLLGRPTAFVAVADQDHHILDYDKRIKWQDTIFAWFARHLKDDLSWWEALYPSTPL